MVVSLNMEDSPSTEVNLREGSSTTEPASPPHDTRRPNYRFGLPGEAQSPSASFQAYLCSLSHNYQSCHTLVQSVNDFINH